MRHQWRKGPRLRDSLEENALSRNSILSQQLRLSIRDLQEKDAMTKVVIINSVDLRAPIAIENRLNMRPSRYMYLKAKHRRNKMLPSKLHLRSIRLVDNMLRTHITSKSLLPIALAHRAAVMPRGLDDKPGSLGKRKSQRENNTMLRLRLRKQRLCPVMRNSILEAKMRKSHCLPKMKHILLL
jgi:hypothetical protein